MESDIWDRNEDNKASEGIPRKLGNPQGVGVMNTKKIKEWLWFGCWPWVGIAGGFFLFIFVHFTFKPKFIPGAETQFVSVVNVSGGTISNIEINCTSDGANNIALSALENQKIETIVLTERGEQAVGMSCTTPDGRTLKHVDVYHTINFHVYFIVSSNSIHYTWNVYK